MSNPEMGPTLEGLQNQQILLDEQYRQGFITADQFYSASNFIKGEIAKIVRRNWGWDGRVVRGNEEVKFSPIGPSLLEESVRTLYSDKEYAELYGLSRTLPMVLDTKTLTAEEIEELKKALASTPIGIIKTSMRPVTRTEYNRMMYNSPSYDTGLYGGEYDRAVVRKSAEVSDYVPTTVQVIWNEYGGQVVCECDNDNCSEMLEGITLKEYAKASGTTGMYRVTSCKCTSGVLGYELIERVHRTDKNGNEAGWLIWEDMHPS